MIAKRGHCTLKSFSGVFPQDTHHIQTHSITLAMFDEATREKVDEHETEPLIIEEASKRNTESVTRVDDELGSDSLII